MLETTSFGPYHFNFHSGDLGNFTIIGPSGSGKTALLAFLLAQAERMRPRIAYFDKDRGAEGSQFDFVWPGGRTRLSLPFPGRHNVFNALAALAAASAWGIGAAEAAVVFPKLSAGEMRGKLLRFAEPQPRRNIGLAWRSTSPRKADFLEFGRIVLTALKCEQSQRAKLCLAAEAHAVNG